MTLCPHCGQPMSNKPQPKALPMTHTEEMAFAKFWAAYPHKIGKAAARKVWLRALRRVDSLEVMLSGLERYIASKPANYAWCNPTTWLDQERWLDQPSYVQVEGDQKARAPHNDGFEIWRVRIRNYLKDGSWPQIAPPLEQCPWQVRAEFEEQLRNKP